MLTLALVVTAVTPKIASADVAGNPYRQVIVDKNVFGLKSPPPPPPPESLKPPPSKLILVGIVNVFGSKKAVIKSAEPPKPTAPGQPAVAEDPYVIMENQMQHGVTVKRIDEKTGTVDVDNNGEQETLTFEKNGAKLPSGPAAPAPASAAGIAGAAGAMGGIPRPGMAGTPFGVRPTGSPALPGMPGASVGGLGTTAGAVGVGVAGTDSTLPTRNVRSQADQPPLSREEQMVMFEVLREKYKNSAMPLPIPPTPLTPTPNNQGGGNSLFPQ